MSMTSLSSEVLPIIGRGG
uniref:Uncharacterized protein n=1 Tax=Arundo donax TaxID=35708 RepID=A0A0A9HRN2_ARUDO